MVVDDCSGMRSGCPPERHQAFAQVMLLLHPDSLRQMQPISRHHRINSSRDLPYSRHSENSRQPPRSRKERHHLHHRLGTAKHFSLIVKQMDRAAKLMFRRKCFAVRQSWIRQRDRLDQAKRIDPPESIQRRQTQGTSVIVYEIVARHTAMVLPRITWQQALFRLDDQSACTYVGLSKTILTSSFHGTITIFYMHSCATLHYPIQLSLIG